LFAPAFEWLVASVSEELLALRFGSGLAEGRGWVLLLVVVGRSGDGAVPGFAAFVGLWDCAGLACSPRRTVDGGSVERQSVEFGALAVEFGVAVEFRVTAESGVPAEFGVAAVRS